MQAMEHLLAGFAATLKLALEGAALIAVFCGVIATALLAAHCLRHRSPTAFIDVRIRFGSWLAVALEFQLGADIVGTTVSPTQESLIQLGLIAIIRTFLNYFLGRELAEQARLKREMTAPPPDQTAR